MKDKQKLSVVGIGRLGLCFCLTLEKSSFDVVGCDIIQSYVDDINSKTFKSHEPFVNAFLNKSKNFSATTDIAKTVAHSNIIFVTVATYSEADGRYDVSQVDSVIDQIINLGNQKNTKHLVICSNVNPGYCDTVYEKLKDLNWNVSYNPETIAQGTIINNQLNPDCIYVGSDNSELSADIISVYKQVCMNNPTYHEMDRLSAELTKVSLNCALTCKISFANMVGDLAVKIGANPDKILSAVGSDKRIGSKFFSYGFGWGGPCFPRDTRAFIRLSKDNKMPYDMCKASNESNEKHLENQIDNFLSSHKLEYYTDSVTYKKGTIILEESHQLRFAIALANKGIKVTIKESPEVIDILKEKYGDLFKYVQ